MKGISLRAFRRKEGTTVFRVSISWAVRIKSSTLQWGERWAKNKRPSSPVASAYFAQWSSYDYYNCLSLVFLPCKIQLVLRGGSES